MLSMSDLSSYLVSQVTRWSQALIPKPVATPPWWCFELKSCFQQAAHRAHLSQSQGHKLLKGILSKQLLPWVTKQSTWLQTLGLQGSPPSHFTLLSHLSACFLQKEPQHSGLPPSLSSKPEASKCFYSTVQGYALLHALLVHSHSSQGAQSYEQIKTIIAACKKKILTADSQWADTDPQRGFTCLYSGHQSTPETNMLQLLLPSSRFSCALRDEYSIWLHCKSDLFWTASITQPYLGQLDVSCSNFLLFHKLSVWQTASRVAPGPCPSIFSHGTGKAKSQELNSDNSATCCTATALSTVVHWPTAWDGAFSFHLHTYMCMSSGEGCG